METQQRFLSLSLLLLILAPCSAMAQARFPDAHDKPMQERQGPVFRLSQDYPVTLPTGGVAPWAGIDFKKNPKDYLQAVLSYAYEGNVTNDWYAEKNTVRRWYHAPWMHWGDKGREFIHGMTRERTSRACELSIDQNKEHQTWAVSMYNDLGGYVLGRVWANPAGPNPAAAAEFPPGTVAVKLLFTQATPQQVPYLSGAPEWEAHIEIQPGVRDIATLRLLQIDIAVRDERAKTWTGWVFGTFQYDAGVKNKDPWQKMTPVALMWGNDPGFTQKDYDAGRRPIQSWINRKAPIVKYRREWHLEMGWAGRANGPVDDQRSSCLSCHSTSQYPAYADLVPSASATKDEDKLVWFRNLKGKAFGPEAQPLDNSLQLAAGIQNFYEWVATVQGLGAKGPAKLPPTPRKTVIDCEAVLSAAAKAGGTMKESIVHGAHLLTIHDVSRDPEAPAIKTLPLPEPVSPP
jgi:hypothetical protein